MNRTVSLLLIAGMFLLLCGCGKGSAAQMEADSGTSLSSEQEHMPVDLQRLACIEVYAADGFLITTIDDYNALARFVDGFTGNMDHWSQDYFSSDLNLPGDTLYCFVVYKAPAARINDGTLDVNMEITLFVDSDIVQFLFYPSGNEAQYFPGGVRFYQESTPDFLHFLTTLAENPDETAGAQSRERNSGVSPQEDPESNLETYMEDRIQSEIEENIRRAIPNVNFSIDGSDNYHMGNSRIAKVENTRIRYF